MTQIADTQTQVSLKLIYLLAMAVLLFAIQQAPLLAALLMVQLFLWARSGLGLAQLWHSIRRLRWFFLLILISYAFVGTGVEAEDRWHGLPVGPWTLQLNLGGLALGGLMCLRVLVLVLTSAWVQKSVPAGALVTGLRRLKVPQTIALVVDAGLELLGSQGGSGSGKGGGKGRGGRRHDAPRIGLREIRQGKLELVRELIRNALARARNFLSERYPDLPGSRLHDLTIILAVCLAIMGLKMMQVLPGIPIASGHKNVLVVPLLLFAAHATHTRLGGFWAGTSVGVLSFLMGFGKYGVLEILHFTVPGLLADLLVPLASARAISLRLFQFAVIGVIMGLGRFAANFAVIVLAGSPEVAYLLFLPAILSQVGFGALSCFVSVAVVHMSLEQAERHSGAPSGRREGGGQGGGGGGGRRRGQKDSDEPGQGA